MSVCRAEGLASYASDASDRHIRQNISHRSGAGLMLAGESLLNTTEPVICEAVGAKFSMPAMLRARNSRARRWAASREQCGPA